MLLTKRTLKLAWLYPSPFARYEDTLGRPKEYAFRFLGSRLA